jgi:hypothetical protein
MARSQSFEAGRLASWFALAASGIVVAGPFGCSESTSENTQADAAATGSSGGSNAGASNGGSSGAGARGSTGGSGNGGSSNGGSSNGGTAGRGGAGSVSTGGGGTSAEAGADASTGGTGNDPCATALFCETFESYTAGAPPGGDWNDQTNNGAVTVETSQHFAGQQSAKFTTEANTGFKSSFIRLEGAPVFPLQGNAFFGRMMTWLESAPEQSVHWTFIQGGGLVPGETYHSLYRYGGQHPVTNGGNFVGTQLMANYETPDSYSGNGPKSDCWDHADKVTLPTGRWACVEWQFDGPNNTMRFWLDGTAIDSLTMQGTGEGCFTPPSDQTWKAPAFDNLELGWESYQGDSARTLYIDDVVLSTSKVGCPAAP